MGLTSNSSEYFGQVAGKWDQIRSGYYGDEVRAAAIRKAYLRPEMVVADVGAGTGYISAGLAPLVRRVYVLDGSPAMLEVARQNLKQYDNLVFQEADGLRLPLPDESLDAVFANMYLHHCPDPLAAIQEMVRLIRPGGRLIITDMDTHPYEWMKAEMADIWQGFERSQVRAWFEEAGLVNVIVDCTGETCNARPENEDSSEKEEARVSVFVAAGTRRVAGVRSKVQENYSAAAQGNSSCCSQPASAEDANPSSSCSTSSCCGSSAEVIPLSQLDAAPGYTPADMQQAPAEAAEISLGCGNPIALAGLKPGETVLDIGSGGGLDAFLAAARVGPAGKVIGVDMTPAMIERARRAAEKGGYSQVEFRLGQAEAMPVEDQTVDVVISNCVINLCEDKGKVFQEAGRVLKSGGRLEISDMVTDEPLPLDFSENPGNWAGCVYGALTEREYLDLIKQAGFQDFQLRRSPSAEIAPGVQIYSLNVSAKRQ